MPESGADHSAVAASANALSRCSISLTPHWVALASASLSLSAEVLRISCLRSKSRLESLEFQAVNARLPSVSEPVEVLLGSYPLSDSSG